MQPSDISRWQGSVNSWLAQDVVKGGATNPVTTTTLCGTGVLVAGYYDFIINLTGTANHYYASIEHRNAINDANVYSWYAAWCGYRHNIVVINNWKVVANERLRVLVINNATGAFLATIQWIIRA